MSQAPVRQFMNPSVLSVAPGLPLAEVAARMCDARVSCAVVCAADGAPLGVITERDMTCAYARDVACGAPMAARSAMSQGVFTLGAETRCDEAMRVMQERALERVVVLDAGRAVAGVITRDDLLRAHAGAVEDRERALLQQVAARTRALSALNTELQTLVRVDPLLGIGNRRAMDEEMERLEARARRYRCGYAVALLDVDSFKKFNDHYGHLAGDEVLRQVAHTLARDVRAADAVFRYGGEEFLVAFPEAGEHGASVAAEHLRRAVERLAIPHACAASGRVSVSIGAAGGIEDDPSWTRMVARADAALYAAKRAGGNRVHRACEVRCAA